MHALRSFFVLTTLLSACSAPTSVTAVDLSTEESVKPGINENFLREGAVEQYTQRFETESREIFSRRKEIVAALGLEPGMEVADIGAGTGLFLGPFAEAVGPEGHVYLVDISPGFVSLIDNRIRRLGLEHATVGLCTDRSVELPKNSVDLVFICDVYHHFEFPRNTLASIHQALRPGGQVVVIDFHRIEGQTSEWTMNHVRAGEEVFTAEIESAGFERTEQRHDLLEANYFLRFVRKDA
ncbi:MAG: Cytochrome peroxidase precursor [Planctomycetota bacterium]|jgi:predicted methyltransferase